MPTIVRIHSAFVWLTVVTLVIAIQIIKKSNEARTLLMRPLKRFAGVLLFQGLVGYLQYFLGVPIGLVAIHVATSVAVWLCVVDVYWSSRLSALPNSVLD
jgi:cytochrome c oxidase assembly protein subunit 15